MPDAFAGEQFRRIFWPAIYDLPSASGGRMRYGTGEMRIDLKATFGHDVPLAAKGDREAQRRLALYRGAVWQLNSLIMAGQDLAAFDWEGYWPEEATKR